MKGHTIPTNPVASTPGILSRLVDVFYSHLTAKGSPDQIITDPITGKVVEARCYLVSGESGIYRRLSPDSEKVSGFIWPEGLKSIYSLTDSDKWTKEHVHVSFKRSVDTISLETLLKTEAPKIKCKPAYGGTEYYLGEDKDPILRINGGASKIAVVCPRYSKQGETKVIKPDDFAVKILNLIYDKKLFIPPIRDRDCLY